MEFADGNMSVNTGLSYVTIREQWCHKHVKDIVSTCTNINFVPMTFDRLSETPGAPQAPTVTEAWPVLSLLLLFNGES